MIWSYVYSVGACISMRSIDRRPFHASRHPRHCCLTRFVTCGAVIGADELFLLFLLFLSFPRRIWPRYRPVCFFWVISVDGGRGVCRVTSHTQTSWYCRRPPVPNVSGISEAKPIVVASTATAATEVPEQDRSIVVASTASRPERTVASEPRRRKFPSETVALLQDRVDGAS